MLQLCRCLDSNGGMCLLRLLLILLLIFVLFLRQLTEWFHLAAHDYESGVLAALATSDVSGTSVLHVLQMCRELLPLFYY